jgi:hypothetical protein
MARGGKKPTTG